MSFLTSFCDLPQNEQRRVSSVRLTISSSMKLLWGMRWIPHRRLFPVRDDLVY